MKTRGSRSKRQSRVSLRGMSRMLSVLVALAGISMQPLRAQTTSHENLSEQIQKLTDTMARTQAQLADSQRQLDELRQQLAALRRQVAQNGLDAAPAPSPGSPPVQSASTPKATSTATASTTEDIRERQAMQESQIATLDQSKVESESKYPVKITGLLLMNGFVNTSAVDIPATPTVALPGPGSTGASVRQTVLGLDARGPHLFGARSFADLRVDFDGSPRSSSTATSYTGYGANSTLLRLRTAHAALQWKNTEAYFSLDRPIFVPDSPTSLTAVAIPPLAWSGNLWAWNPQIGVNQDLPLARSRDLQLQAALVDVGNAPLSPTVPVSGALTAPSTAEQSRWPGVEARVALLGSTLNDEGSHFGIGGYFAPHLISHGSNFDSWAGTLDYKQRLPAGLDLTASFYRGAALGSLGGGAFKDFAYYTDPDSGTFYFRPLDDVGGWAQLKEQISERVQLNASYGLDEVFANELRFYYVPSGNNYQNLARNRTYTGNVIYSPSAYLLFSLEYRHLESSPVVGPSAGSNVVGLGAGYKF